MAEFGINKLWLEKVLSKEVGSDQFNVIDYSIQPASAVGDNLLGALFAVTVTIETNNQQKTLNIVAKFPPPGEFLTNLMESANIYTREIYFYSQILPEFQKFQENNTKMLKEFAFPKYIYGHEEGKRFLVMENLKTQGFQTIPDKSSGLDVAHCRLVLDELARFHAVSFAMRVNGEDLKKKLEHLTFGSTWHECQSGAFTAGVPLAQKLVEGQDAALAEILDNLTAEKIRDISLDPEHLCPDSPFQVIVHGDCWTNNILFKYDKKGETPVDLRLVDLQMVRVSTVAIDVVQFLFTSTTPQFRQTHLDSLTEYYHSSLLHYIQQYDVATTQPKYGFDVFMEDFRKVQPFLLLLSMSQMQVLFQKGCEVIDMEKAAENKWGSYEEEQKSILACRQDNTAMISRMVGLVREMDAAGMFQ